MALDLERILTRPIAAPPKFKVAEIRCETLWLPARDGIRLATDLYLPPTLTAPAVAMRTPYGRAADKTVAVCIALARRGYAVVAQDCRGTGESEPDHWDYYVYEPEDGYDLVDWITRQSWFDGFVGACGGSYVGQTQWGMAVHPAMTTIVPEVSGLGIAVNTARLHMFVNAFARSVGKGADKTPIPHAELERRMLQETLAGGFFNEPLQPQLPQALMDRHPEISTMSPADASSALWRTYCGLGCAGRADFIKQVLGIDSVTITAVEALPAIFGHGISHDAHSLPFASFAERVAAIKAPPLMITGWYDWGLNDALMTWQSIKEEGREPVGSRARLIITPGSHGGLGYREGIEGRPELQRSHRLENNVPLLLEWYAAVRAQTLDDWPNVIYYLMGANEWRSAPQWPPPDVDFVSLYLGSEGELSTRKPPGPSTPDRYTYDPNDPPPTVGGSILSSVYPAGSVDVAHVQARADVVTYTTAPLKRDLDVVGPLRLVLYASSSATDTDFVARLTDVFPDGRAIQLQNGVLRARYRNPQAELLEPGRPYRMEVDMWATANRFRRGHRIRVDISSADFPRFDRNANLGGARGAPIVATQILYHDAERPSHLRLPCIARREELAEALGT